MLKYLNSIVLKLSVFIFIAFLVISCNYFNQKYKIIENKKVVKIKSTTKTDTPQINNTNIWHNKLINAGFQRITDVDSTIKINIKYSTIDNFMQQDAYGDFDDAYLRAEIVRKICAAQGNIKQNNENYTLIVYDAFRPRSVQILMWDIVKNTPQAAYVANPYKGKGSLHNLGVAVDVSIFDLKNNLPLDMGTPYDFLGALAEPQLENTFLKAGKLTLAQINNRHLLKKAMLEAGFSPIPREWWHFDGFPRSVAEKKYDFLQ